MEGNEVSVDQNPKGLTSLAVKLIEEGKMLEGHDTLVTSYNQLMNLLEELSGNAIYESLGHQASEVLDESMREVLRLTLQSLMKTSYALDRKEDACTYSEKYLELEKTSSSDWKRLGDTYTDLGQDRKAMRAYRYAACYAPDSIDIWKVLENSFSNLDRYDEAKRCEIGFSKEPTEIKRIAAVELLLLANKPFEAKDIAYRIQLENPKSVEALMLRAKSDLVYHNYFGAQDALEEALSIAPDNPDVEWLYARALCKANKLEQARDHLIRFLHRFPDSIDAKYLLFEADRRAKLGTERGREQVAFNFYISVGGEKEVSSTSMPLGTTVLEAAFNPLWGLLLTLAGGGGMKMHKGFKTHGLEIGDLSFQFSSPRGSRKIESPQPASLDAVLVHEDVIWVTEKTAEFASERLAKSMERFGL